MSFDEWFTQFFTGMPPVPDYVRWAYQAAYQAGYAQGTQDAETLLTNKPTPGWEGERDGT
jgi:hypothetical protein